MHLIGCVSEPTSATFFYERMPSALLIVVYLMVWAKGSDMRPLGQFTTPELIKTLNALDAHKFEYKVEQGSNTIYVKGDDYNNIVLSLKRDGVMGEEVNSVSLYASPIIVTVCKQHERFK